MGFNVKIQYIAVTAVVFGEEAKHQRILLHISRIMTVDSFPITNGTIDTRLIVDHHRIRIW